MKNQQSILAPRKGKTYVVEGEVIGIASSEVEVLSVDLELGAISCGEALGCLGRVRDKTIDLARQESQRKAAWDTESHVAERMAIMTQIVNHDQKRNLHREQSCYLLLRGVELRSC